MTKFQLNKFDLKLLTLVFLNKNYNHFLHKDEIYTCCNFACLFKKFKSTALLNITIKFSLSVLIDALAFKLKIKWKIL